MKQTKVLCILDGFGFRESATDNPFSTANIPNFKTLLNQNPWITLGADGLDSGQEEGMVGNSEVGHMNMGALRLVKQLSQQITGSSKNFYKLTGDNPDQIYDPALLIKEKSVVHLIGLFSSGSVHSDLRHWIGAIGLCCQQNCQVVLHLISDGRDSGRDTFAKTWLDFTQENIEIFQKYSENIFLGSMGGRFYAMDRDNNLDRTGRYVETLFAKPKNNDLVKSVDIYETILDFTNKSYAAQVFDEYLEPTVFKEIENDEIVWLINFRTDRMKQLTRGFCQKSGKNNLTIIANNSYGIGLEEKPNGVLKNSVYYPLFTSRLIRETFGEYIENQNQNQLRIAETEKFNHVTYFFNGGSNTKQKNEDWIMIDSDKVSSYDQKPQMKAVEITDFIINEGLGKYDYIIVNFANADMVGHTGNFSASVKALEFLDTQIGRLTEVVENGNHKMLITADHGNIEMVGTVDEGGFDTKHNPNPVPLIFVGKNLDVKTIISPLSPNLENSKIYIDQILKDLESKVFIQTDNKGWLSSDQIKQPVLPIWVVGLLLIKM
jgi:2,3-bisphosphoglycerate-independent phosphoglycerate mutase